MPDDLHPVSLDWYGSLPLRDGPFTGKEGTHELSVPMSTSLGRTKGCGCGRTFAQRMVDNSVGRDPKYAGGYLSHTGGSGRHCYACNKDILEPEGRSGLYEYVIREGIDENGGPHVEIRVDSRKLLKALKEQNWRCEQKKNGDWTFWPPDEKMQPIFAHNSMMANKSKVGFLHLMADLKKAGFQDPDVFKREQREKAKKERDLAHAAQIQADAGNGSPTGTPCSVFAERDPKEYPIEAECGARFKMPVHAGRHMQMAHGVDRKAPVPIPKDEWKDKPQPDRAHPKRDNVPPKSTPKASPVKVTQVEPTDPAERIKYHLAKMDEGVAMVKDHANVIKSIVAEDYKANKKKLEKLEKLFGQAVDAL